MWWSTTTLFIKPKRLTSGSRSIPDLSCCGCRRIVPEPIRLNGPLGMCTTSAPAIISASAYAIWSRMSSIICRLMGPGTIKSLGFTMSPKSPSRSTVWSLSNSHESPPECTNLVWSGLEEALAAHGIAQNSTVVLYSRDTTAAARVAALLLYAGVDGVHVLDGGQKAWIAAGYPVETLPRQA